MLEVSEEHRRKNGACRRSNNRLLVRLHQLLVDALEELCFERTIFIDALLYVYIR